MNRFDRLHLLLGNFVLALLMPTLVLAQHGPTPLTTEQEYPEVIEHSNLLYECLEWAESIVDLTGILILLIGFVKGVLVFLKWEIDKIKGAKGADVYDDVVALRSTLGWYIILSLDFLIISDILHSIISPQFEELINLGIIVILRTSIGFFLGRELMELRHAEQEEREHEAAEKVIPKVQ